MSEDTTHLVALDVDDAWLAEWAAEGIAALERLLSRHAAFGEYLRARAELRSDDGDGAGTR
jgi:hypothetical protein